MAYSTVHTETWLQRYPVLHSIQKAIPITWLNPHKQSSPYLNLAIGRSEMDKALTFMEMYAPYIAKIFPETAFSQGEIISPLQEITQFQSIQNQKNTVQIDGRFFLKCDHALPVAGSIKARGGFFEVLSFAHSLAVKEGFTSLYQAADFHKPELRALFSKYTIGVGSTGNLGMSIGIISAKLGFQVKVYMSHDAKEWKKNVLRKNGAQVIEEKGDFGVAIARGRQETLAQPYGYFVDDENSGQLFLGYSLAAFELQKQLVELGITIDEEHPLFVYSPCGVGGSPGGVAFGLKMLYGNAVHPFFVEPTHAPAVLIGSITGEKEKISVQDLGLDNLTEADGLAVGRPSAYASEFIIQLISGMYTIEDETLVTLVKELYTSEKIFVEPSATAGLIGPQQILATDYCQKNNIQPEKITHIAWSTGGNLVPEEIRKQLLA